MQTQFVTTVFDFVEPGHFRPIPELEAAKALFKKSVKLVEIEIFSYCNRRCWFCPNASIDRRSENIYMESELYESILRDLGQIDYSGTVSFGRYNEPLADQVVVERIRQARAALPNATLHVSTNGDYLTLDYLEHGVPDVKVEHLCSLHYTYGLCYYNWELDQMNLHGHCDIPNDLYDCSLDQEVLLPNM